MTIKVKNKGTLEFKEFKFKCCFGLNGLTKTKKEGDKKTPIGIFEIGNLYYRSDKSKKPHTKLKVIKIKKKMGWCNDPTSKNYNKLIQIKGGNGYEKLFRKDYKYDFLIPIYYNFKKTIPFKGSAIFIHLTKDYKTTAGCVALKKKDFLILIKLINKKTKIKISRL